MSMHCNVHVLSLVCPVTIISRYILSVMVKPSPVTRHPSPITHHPSPVICHPSPVNRSSLAPFRYRLSPVHSLLVQVKLTCHSSTASRSPRFVIGYHPYMPC